MHSREGWWRHLVEKLRQPTMKLTTFDDLTRLHHCQGLNLYLADCMATELQCQWCSGILHSATLSLCKVEGILDRALHGCNGWHFDNNDTAALDNTPTFTTSRPVDPTEEFWDVDLDPDLPLLRPGPPRFPMPEPPPLCEELVEEPIKEKSVWEPADSGRHWPKRDFVVTRDDVKKVFVGNVNFGTTQGVLWKFFEKFGGVKYCRLLRDRITRSSKGRAVVTFACEEAAIRATDACDTQELMLHGRLLVVKAATRRQYLPTEGSTRDLDGGNDSSKDERQIDADSSVTDVTAVDDDVMLHIFSYLTLRERVQSERVLTEPILRGLLERGSTQLLTLDVSASPRRLADGAMQCIAKNSPNLTHINLTGASLGNVGLKKLSAGCRGLQSVCLRQCREIGEDGYWWLFHQCKQLRCVDVEGSSRLKGPCCHVLGTQLDTLVLNGCCKLKDVAMEKIADRCQQLRHIELDRCPALTDAGVTCLATKCSTLRLVRITGNSQLTSTSLRHLGALYNLQELYVSNNLGVDDSVLEAVGRGCGQLRVLDVTGCHRAVTDQGLCGLAACSRLQRLYISYLHQVVESGLTSLAHNCSLVSVEARGCSHLAEAAVISLVELCYDLRHLDVSGCVQLGNSTLQCIVSGRGQHGQGVLSLYIGGTSMDPAGLDIPTLSGLYIHQDDFCMYHLIPDRELVCYFGDSDEDEFGEDDDVGDDMDLDMDDPLDFERWNLS